MIHSGDGQHALNPVAEAAVDWACLDHLCKSCSHRVFAATIENAAFELFISLDWGVLPRESCSMDRGVIARGNCFWYLLPVFEVSSFTDSGVLNRIHSEDEGALIDQGSYHQYSLGITNDSRLTIGTTSLTKSRFPLFRI